jgi:hypothetical protein
VRKSGCLSLTSSDKRNMWATCWQWAKKGRKEKKGEAPISSLFEQIISCWPKLDRCTNSCVASKWISINLMPLLASLLAKVVPFQGWESKHEPRLKIIPNHMVSTIQFPTKCRHLHFECFRDWVTSMKRGVEEDFQARRSGEHERGKCLLASSPN